MTQHAADQFAVINQLRSKLRDTGLTDKARLKLTTALVDAYTALVNNLIVGIHTATAEPGTDDDLPQIVVRLLGIDISARQRPGDPDGDVLIHIEDTRADADRRATRLVVNVNDTGEHRYT